MISVAYQMADAVFVFDIGCLGSFAFIKTISQYGPSRCTLSSPAPGGPIRIMRIASVVDLDFDPSSWKRASSCRTRDSSLWTRSFRSCTVSSLIGAILGECARKEIWPQSDVGTLTQQINQSSVGCVQWRKVAWDGYDTRYYRDERARLAEVQELHAPSKLSYRASKLT